MFLPTSFILVMGLEGPSAQSWRSMAGRMINSQLTLNLCGICCSTWMDPHVSMRLQMGFIQEYSRAGWCHCEASLNYFWIIPQSWVSEEFWADWKLAKVVSMFKKDDPGNYKPVSLTPVPGKIMKIILGVLKNVWMKHLNDTAAIVTATTASWEESPVCPTWLPFRTGWSTWLIKGSQLMWSFGFQ